MAPNIANSSKEQGGSAVKFGVRKLSQTLKIPLFFMVDHATLCLSRPTAPYPPVINLQQGHQSVCEHRARSLSPLPCDNRGGISTSLRRLEGEDDRELSPQRRITESNCIYRKDARTDPNLETDEVIDATTAAAQLQTIGDRSWRSVSNSAVPWHHQQFDSLD